MIRAFDIRADDLKIAEEFAREAVGGMHEQSRSSEDHFIQVLSGKIAELAFKRFCEAQKVNVLVDLTVYEGQEGVDDADIYDDQERALDLDIKGVKPNANFLIVKVKASHHAKIYIVVKVALKHKRVLIHGWTTKKLAMNEVMFTGDKIPGTETTCRVDSYIKRLDELFDRDEDIEELLDMIREGKIIKDNEQK